MLNFTDFPIFVSSLTESELNYLVSCVLEELDVRDSKTMVILDGYVANVCESEGEQHILHVA